MFDLSDQEAAREVIRGMLSMVRGLSVEIDSAEQAVFERLESLHERAHDARLRYVPKFKALYDAYVDAGFSHEQATLFLLNSQVALEKQVNAFFKGIENSRAVKKSEA